MKTPYFIINADCIEENLKILRNIIDETGCKILLAQKCFSCYGLYPLIAKYLNGATASGLYEARLCHEEMPNAENHVFSPAFTDSDIDEIIKICDHIVFNSPQQLSLYGSRAKNAGLHVGLRINPECSTQKGHAIYDPCFQGSRLGTTISVLQQYIKTEDGQHNFKFVDGLHFHTLCEQNSDDLATTLNAVEDKFGHLLKQMQWLNFGGGHHITRSDYDINLLKQCINGMQSKYNLQVYLEPGEAIALNAGELHSTILEIQPKSEDGISNVIIDTSAACHMPDVIEMPYTPPLNGAYPIENLRQTESNEACLSYQDAEEGKARSGLNTKTQNHNTYRLGGSTCLSGDIIGTYTFDHELHIGEKLIFQDMAIYSMVKTNTFNGMPLPDIYIQKGKQITLWKHFTYQDFKSRV